MPRAPEEIRLAPVAAGYGLTRSNAEVLAHFGGAAVRPFLPQFAVPLAARMIEYPAKKTVILAALGQERELNFVAAARSHGASVITTSSTMLPSFVWFGAQFAQSGRPLMIFSA